MIAGLVVAITSVIGVMTVFNRQTNRRFDDIDRRFDDVNRDIASVRDEANKNTDVLREEMASVRKELHDLTLHLIPRPPARRPESMYKTATEQGVIREQPKK